MSWAVVESTTHHLYALAGTNKPAIAIAAHDPLHDKPVAEAEFDAISVRTCSFAFTALHTPDEREL